MGVAKRDFKPIFRVLADQNNDRLFRIGGGFRRDFGRLRVASSRQLARGKFERGALDFDELRRFGRDCLGLGAKTARFVVRFYRNQRPGNSPVRLASCARAFSDSISIAILSGADDDFGGDFPAPSAAKLTFGAQFRFGNAQMFGVKTQRALNVFVPVGPIVGAGKFGVFVRNVQTLQMRVKFAVLVK